jgi:hypothetical protein
MFYAAFESLELAQQFEEYLKSGSGHEFAKHHLDYGVTPRAGLSDFTPF